MNAYTLGGLLTSVIDTEGRAAATTDQWLQMFFSELWLTMVKE